MRVWAAKTLKDRQLIGELTQCDGKTLSAETSRNAPLDGDISSEADYFIRALPIEVHCHGISGVDFSEFDSLDLHRLNIACTAEGIVCIPTLYLRRNELESFQAFMHRFARLRQEGALPLVAGVALEGPLLASPGGTPSPTTWLPTKEEWARLAGCGSLGLCYIVLSPDALAPGSALLDGMTAEHPDLGWIARTLVEAGVRPSLGHFSRTDPQRSAELVEEIVAEAWAAKSPLDGARIVTDHLFNDMPVKVQYAFRTTLARAVRDQTIASYDLPSWSLSNLPERIGVLPASILRLCSQGRIAACINFDGEHLDLAIASRVAQIVPTQNIMIMTDRCDSRRLAGERLHRSTENTLWYQATGIVAAGSHSIDRHISNARSAGLDEASIWDMVAFSAARAFGIDPSVDGNSGSFVIAGDTGFQGTSDHRVALVPAIT